MKKSSNKSEKDRLEKSAWLLNPARTKETILKYGIVVLVILTLTFLLS